MLYLLASWLTVGSCLGTPPALARFNTFRALRHSLLKARLRFFDDMTCSVVQGLCHRPAAAWLLQLANGPVAW